MQRKPKRSSILKPPKQVLRAPLQDLDSLPVDEDDGNSTQPTSRRVSFSRTSQIKEFDPSIGYMTKWNQSYEESIDSIENDENQAQCANVYDGLVNIQSQNLNKRKRTCTLQLSLNSNKVNVDGGECTDELMQENGDKRIAKHRRKSMEFLRSEVVEEGDMAAFYDELNLTESVKYRSMIGQSTIDTRYLESTVSGNEFLNETCADVDGMDLTVTLGKIQGNPWVADGEDIPDTHDIPDKSDHNLEGTRDKNLNHNEVMEMKRSENTIAFEGDCKDMGSATYCIIDLDAANYEGLGRRLTSSLCDLKGDKFEDTVNEAVIESLVVDETNPGTVGMEMTVPLGKLRVEKVDDIDKTTTESHVVDRNESNLEYVDMELTVTLGNLKAENCEELPDGHRIKVQNINDYTIDEIVEESQVAFKNDSEEVDMDFTIPVGKLRVGKADPIEHTATECHSVDETDSEDVGMDLTIPLGKLIDENGGDHLGEKGTNFQNIKKEVADKLEEDSLMAVKNDSEEVDMEFTVPIGKLRVGKADPIEHTATECHSVDEAVGMDLTIPLGKLIDENGGDHLGEKGTNFQNIKKEFADKLEEDSLMATKNDSEEVDMKFTVPIGKLRVGKADPIEHTATECHSVDEAVGMDLTIPLGKLKTKEHEDHPDDKGMESQNVIDHIVDEMVGEPVVLDKSNAEGKLRLGKADLIEHTTTECHSVDETDSEAIGMELTVPLGKLKAKKHEDHPDDKGMESQNVIDHIVDEMVGEPVVLDKSNSEGKLRLGKADLIEHTTTECHSVDETDSEAIGMELTVPLGKLKAKKHEDHPDDKGMESQNIIDHIVDEVEGEPVVLDKSKSEEVDMEFTLPQQGLKEHRWESSVNHRSMDSQLLGDTYSVPVGTELTIPLGQFKEENAVPVGFASVNSHGVVDITSSEAVCMELTIPFGRLKTKSILPVDGEAKESYSVEGTNPETSLSEMSVSLEKLKEENSRNVDEVESQTMSEIIPGELKMELDILPTRFEGGKSGTSEDEPPVCHVLKETNCQEINVEGSIQLDDLEAADLKDINDVIEGHEASDAHHYEAEETGCADVLEKSEEQVLQDVVIYSTVAETLVVTDVDIESVEMGLCEKKCEDLVNATDLKDNRYEEEVALNAEEMEICTGLERLEGPDREEEVDEKSCDVNLEVGLVHTSECIPAEDACVEKGMEICMRDQFEEEWQQENAEMDLRMQLEEADIQGRGNDGAENLSSPKAIQNTGEDGCSILNGSEGMCENNADEPSGLVVGSNNLVLNKSSNAVEKTLLDPSTKMNPIAEDYELSKLADTSDPTSVESKVKSLSSQQCQKPKESRIKDWIIEEAKKVSCYWAICDLLEDQYSFRVFHKEALLVVDLQPLEDGQDPTDNRCVRSVYLEATASEDSDRIMTIVTKALIHRLPSDVLSSKCLSTEELPSLLRFISTQLNEMGFLLKQAYVLKKTSPVKFTTDGFSFKALHMKPLVMFKVQISFLHWENGGVKPEGIEVKNIIGKTRLSDIQAVIKDIKRDEKYFMRVYDDVFRFIFALESVLEDES